MTETIGFIGLGVLGSAVAENLVKAGLGVIAHDISADKLTAFERQGGQAAASPNDVADRSNVVVLCLATVKALHDVVGGKDGLVRGGDDGQIIVDISTFAIADKEKARKVLAAAGKILLDCPVSGNRILALQRKLTVFGSGDRAAYEAVEHILGAFAHRTFYVGEFGSGMKMKFCGMCGRLRVGKGFLNDIARAGRSCHVFGLLMRRLQMAAGHNALREIGSRS